MEFKIRILELRAYAVLIRTRLKNAAFGASGAMTAVYLYPLDDLGCQRHSAVPAPSPHTDPDET